MDAFIVQDRGLTYRIEQVEEGGYFGQVVELPTCITEGLTLDETITNLRDALALYIEVADEDGIEVSAPLRQGVAAAS
ncbi:MAG: type II toxin-antitoxin system HicB family antitoxin [Dehalococcoidia bacterium]|uniref:type II toxin-antitoxin system HicB family antitoxin n=1 Tax=Candidatus Amarobacter glycogenicus TaxID=3140699 RepID=UPI001D962337|nr:type II toxin-antitoxin system HicB family antitoxin [Dehalococcoidia bacterium]MBK6562994.1 type II toxin-antitoxin system HicB family antitoxin [Dehalococcoidia bacterium]MBK7329235.1 type II toxin-antitoxin system HicB family antitoxin [Dehalococcoidia bacterium]MBK7725286.1 type II toxin-antitoxin system HicB family antitoxin [Dehalococcoidia bacterium]MBK9546543.1 type II toxin-antitoxin system HicB family antitoxin [Dehalococcoidia bacterium]